MRVSKSRNCIFTKQQWNRNKDWSSNLLWTAFWKKCPPAIRFRWMLMVAKFILRLMKHGWSRSQFRRKDLLALVRTWHSDFYLTVSSCASFIFIYPRLSPLLVSLPSSLLSLVLLLSLLLLSLIPAPSSRYFFFFSLSLIVTAVL